MAQLPPTPVGVPPGSSYWNDWYEKLRYLINSAIQNHNDLQNIQGGNSTERYHLTAAQQAAVLAQPPVTTGTITPTVIGTTVAGTGTYTSQTGKWARHGNLVYFNLAVTWTAHTGTGNLELTGLPYAATDRAPVSARFADITYTAGSTPYISTIGSSTNLQVAQFSSAAAAANIPMDGERRGRLRRLRAQRQGRVGGHRGVEQRPRADPRGSQGGGLHGAGGALRPGR